VIKWDTADGSWLTAPLADIHRKSLLLPTHRAVSGGRRRSSILVDYGENGGYIEGADATDGEIQGAGRQGDDVGSPWNVTVEVPMPHPQMRRNSSGGLGPQLASAVLEKIGGEWHEAMWQEWELLQDFINRSSAVLALQSGLAIAVAHYARLLLSSRPATSASISMAGTALVAAGCLVIERADVGFRLIEADDEEEEEEEELSLDSPLSRQQQASSPQVLTLACNREGPRWMGLGLIVAGFVSAVGPLLAEESAREAGGGGRAKLVNVAGLFGASTVLSLIVRVPQNEAWEWWARVSFLGIDRDSASFRVGQDAEDGAGHHWGGGAGRGSASAAGFPGREMAVRGREGGEVQAAGGVGAAHESTAAKLSAWARKFMAAIPLRRSWVVGSVFGAAFAAMRVSGAGGGATTFKAREAILVAMLKPVSLLLLHAGDLKNTYRGASLRVYCPRSHWSANGGSMAMCMWHQQGEVLTEERLQKQMSCLQVHSTLVRRLVPFCSFSLRDPTPFLNSVMGIVVYKLLLQTCDMFSNH
jgi:hypothetical protein